MKVYGYNCFGICIVRIDVEKIKEWNAKHPFPRDQIFSWKES